MKKKINVYGLSLIQLSIGLYFTISGLLGIMGFNSGANQFMNEISAAFGEADYLPLVIAICFFISGILLFAGVIFTIKQPIIFLVIFLLWAAYIFITYFTDDFLKPNTLSWLKEVSLQFVVLTGLWGTTQKVK